MEYTNKSVLNKLRQDYGLNPIRVEKLKGGTEGVAWRIDTENEKFVTKLFGSKDDTFERVSKEVMLYKFINENGKQHNIQAPEVISDISGGTVQLLDEKPLIVMKFENLHLLRPESVTREEIIKLAKAIAHLHMIAKKYKHDSYKPNYIGWNLEYNRNALEVFTQSPNARNVSKETLKAYEKIVEKIIQYLEKTSYPKELSESLLHSDIAFEHAQILPNRNIYFFDWADRCHGPVARELAILLFHSFREGNISFERWQDIREWTLEGYTSVTKLSKADIDTILPFLLRRCLDEVLYLSNLAIEIKEPVDVKGITRRFILAEKLVETYLS